MLTRLRSYRKTKEHKTSPPPVIVKQMLFHEIRVEIDILENGVENPNYRTLATGWVVRCII